MQVNQVVASVLNLGITDATHRRLWEDLEEFRDVYEEESLIYLTGEFSKTYISTLFAMYFHIHANWDSCSNHPNNAFLQHTIFSQQLFFKAYLLKWLLLNCYINLLLTQISSGKVVWKKFLSSLNIMGAFT